MDKIIDKAKKLTLSFDAALPYNREELLKQSYYELGEAQGIEQNIMQTAIKMLKENINVNTIIKKLDYLKSKSMTWKENYKIYSFFSFKNVVY